MTPRVTVAIPFHDEERHLGAAVRSVLAQSYRDFELLLLDDGSRDGSLRVAEELAGDPRVRVLAGGARRYLPARLNEIVREARGDLVARMDADDVMHPLRLEREVALLDATGCDGVGTWAALVDDREEPLAVVEASPRGATAADVLVRGLVPHATLVARTSWLRTVPYDETLTRAEDRDLWCRVVGHARIEVVPDVLYVVRVSTSEERFLGDYARGQADLRRVVRRYGPEAVGIASTARLLGASFAKTAAMAVLHRAGLSARLVPRRGRAPTLRERERIREALRAGQRP